MSQHTSSILFDPRSSHYRQKRRRWVPKAVVLLSVLFVVGLVSASQSASEKVVAIAVPAAQLTVDAIPRHREFVAPTGIVLDEHLAGYATRSAPPSLVVGLNSF